MTLVISKLETARFGMTCAKIDGLGEHLPDLPDINRQAKEMAVSMISTRVDASATSRIHALEADGYRLMDTLVWYGGVLDQLNSRERDLPGISLRLATPADAHSVEAVGSAAFKEFLGHYHADPRLNNAAADAAYAEWSKTSIEQVTQDNFAFLALKRDEPVGFLSTNKVSDDEYNIVLNAVHPDHQGAGIYGTLLSNSVRHMQSAGATRVTISTQINNYAVQRAWSRLGLYHQQSRMTFHKWFD